MEEEARKVKATWYRIVYCFEDYAMDYYVDNFGMDKYETVKLENPVAIREYDSVGEAVCDFLVNNVKHDDDDACFAEVEAQCLIPYRNFLPKGGRVEVVQDFKMKMDNGGNLIPISKEEIDKKYDYMEDVEYYQYSIVLQLEYEDGSDANEEAGRIFEEKYRKIYG